tara:strand:+ start:31 stop:405 length:375 start_codon:yes stop_codon:yes gene_type:complete
MTFRLIVAGSRDINVSIGHVFSALDQLEYPVTHVVSGCARGGDRLGEHYAKSRNLVVDKFPADWNKHGRSAGYKRNEQMAEVADALFAIWDGKSRGTQHMINIARTAGKPVHIYNTVTKTGYAL